MNLLSFELPSSQKSTDAAMCIARFLSLPEHHWILSNMALRDRFAHFLSLLPNTDLQKILEKRRLLLLYCNQRMSCAFYQFSNREVVLLFPELIRLLESSKYLEGYAVLAHELGHIAYGHSRNAIAPMRAQLEADRYAASLGLGEELFRLLRMEHPSEEIRERLTALRKLF